MSPKGKQFASLFGVCLRASNTILMRQRLVYIWLNDTLDK